jgi:hypothetical protein
MKRVADSTKMADSVKMAASKMKAPAGKMGTKSGTKAPGTKTKTKK